MTVKFKLDQDVNATILQTLEKNKGDSNLAGYLLEHTKAQDKVGTIAPNQEVKIEAKTKLEVKDGKLTREVVWERTTYTPPDAAAKDPIAKEKRAKAGGPGLTGPDDDA